MHSTFTGSSRRQRQVNLSGRKPNVNPFAKPNPLGSQQAPSAVVDAQQQRLERQKARQELEASRTLQRVYRGHLCRKAAKTQLREEFNAAEGDPERPYKSEEEAYTQLARLLQFLDVRKEEDLDIVDRVLSRLQKSIEAISSSKESAKWAWTLLHFEKTLLRLLEFRSRSAWAQQREGTLRTFRHLHLVTGWIPKETASNGRQYYGSISKVVRGVPFAELSENESKLIAEVAGAPLPPAESDTGTESVAYEAFGCELLPALQIFFVENSEKASAIDPAPGSVPPHFLRSTFSRGSISNLAKGLQRVAGSANYKDYQDMIDPGNRLRLLSSFIYLYTAYSSSGSHSGGYPVYRGFISVVSSLLASLGDEVNFAALDQPSSQSISNGTFTLYASQNDFIRHMLLSLVDQSSISQLLDRMKQSPRRQQESREDDASQLATYALALIRFFPRKADDIRIALYLGPGFVEPSLGSSENLTTMRFLWQVVEQTDVFRTICADSRAAIRLLKPPRNNKSRPQDEAWRIILLFLELYSLGLRVTDDEEFFSASVAPNTGVLTTDSKRRRESSLPLHDVEKLVLFLKNLGFTLSFNAADIEDVRERDEDAGSISTYFRTANNSMFSSTIEEPAASGTKQDTKAKSLSVTGFSFVTLEYFKGLVIGVMRQIYQRDSRRRFLPKDHWLMTSRFDMKGFIPTVVKEEENRQQVERDENEAGDGQDNQEAGFSSEEEDADEPRLIGTGHFARHRAIDKLQRQQRRTARRKFMQAVAPRIEILQNMPFFIPFQTRVQIFREFVNLDKMRRRDGVIDPDMWRMAVARPLNRLNMHHATIQRGQEFDDAFEQFNGLGEGLKEPIQITFVDQWGNEEPGIDGGGVTKEFLTSVTTQAFSPSENHLDLFKENSENLLYPNPTVIDEIKEMITQQGTSLQSSEAKVTFNSLLSQYEFLGRIIGKCMYEGILIDVSFAPFFLLKWALTGGFGAAPKESGYRADLNGLRDLDEELYKGLLYLKNYDGNVEEDFGLNFTVTDQISLPGAQTKKTITKDLKPNGANEAVTNQNRLNYIAAVANYRLQQQPKRQTQAFLDGLSSMIQPSWLNMFNQSELQALVGGASSAIDIADLRRNTQYSGVYMQGDDGLDHPTIQLFWKVMSEISEPEQRAVIKFVTSTPRAPLLGFGSLNPKFSIRDSSHDQERLPTTSTCVNLLKLPIYKDAKILKEKLLAAVLYGAGFDLS